MSQTIATVKGRENLAKARAGIRALPKCKTISLGDGGVNGSGGLKTPTDTATGLYNEIVNRDIVQPPTFKTATTATYIVKLTASEFPDVKFSEIGLYDEEDTLIAIKTFNPKQKDGDMEMQFEIDDVF